MFIICSLASQQQNIKKTWTERTLHIVQNVIHEFLLSSDKWIVSYQIITKVGSKKQLFYVL